MEDKLTILVIGATGAQGGSVAKALLRDKRFAVRAMTRNLHSEKAQALREAGAEIVTGDLGDPLSLRQAMDGCYGVFGVTSYWEHFGGEFRLGKNLVNAVKAAGIRHFVFSGMDSYRKLSGGKFPVAHYDVKAELQDYIRELKLPATFVQASFYYENFLNYYPLQKGDNGSLYFGFPQGDTRLASISVEDYGPVVAGIFNHPYQYFGRTVRAVGADQTGSEYAAAMTRALGRKIWYRYITREVYASLGFPGAAELANMFEVQRLYIPHRKLDLIETYALNADTQPFDHWVLAHREAFIRHIQAIENESIAV